MAETICFTPTDLLTGLPLPFLPDPNLPPVPHRRGMVPPNVADLNHAWHPSTDPLFLFQPDSLMPNAGPALRESRVQWVLRPQHELYHRTFYGPPLPNTIDQTFFACVLAAAGYVPEEGLSFSEDAIQVVTFSNVDRERLRASGELRMASGDTVRRFLLEFAFTHGGTEAQPNVVNEFIGLAMSGKRPERQARLAHKLLKMLIEPSVGASLYDTYRYAKTNSLIAPRLPRSPYAFVKTAITKGEEFPRVAMKQLLRHFVELKFGNEHKLHLAA